MSSQGDLSICSGPQPRIGAVDVLRSSVQEQHVFPVALATDLVFVLTRCDTFFIPPSDFFLREIDYVTTNVKLVVHF